MEIQLQLYSILREKLPAKANGQTVLQLKESTSLAELLEKLDISRRVVISVNDVHESDMSCQLQNGDKVKIFSSVSGG